LENNLAKELYTSAMAIAQADLPWKDASAVRNGIKLTNVPRLGLVLNYSVFLYYVLHECEAGLEMTRDAFEDVLGMIDGCFEGEDVFGDTVLMQKLRDNLVLWTSDDEDEEATYSEV